MNTDLRQLDHLLTRTRARARAVANKAFRASLDGLSGDAAARHAKRAQRLRRLGARFEREIEAMTGER